MVSCHGIQIGMEAPPDILLILVDDMDTNLTETRIQAVFQPEILSDLSGKCDHWADQMR
jgi:hypothetical protein